MFGIQLSNTFFTNKIESDADLFSELAVNEDQDDFVTKRQVSKKSYLDSISNLDQLTFLPKILRPTYSSFKSKELKRGLDLQGGINVILQISVKDILKGLAENTTDPDFNRALNEADILQKSSSDNYIESFFIAFETVAPDKNLASPDIFANRTLSDDINFQMTNSDVKPILRTKIDESIISAFEVLRKRIDQFGVSSPNIQRLGNSGRILVELPGAKDIDRVKKLLQSTAQLEFWTSEKNQEYFRFLSEANQVLKEIYKEEVNTEQDEKSEIDDLLADVEVNDSINVEKNPLLDLIIGTGFQGGPVLAQFNQKDKELVNEYLSNPRVRQLLPPSKR